MNRKLSVLCIRILLILCWAFPCHNAIGQHQTAPYVGLSKTREPLILGTCAIWTGVNYLVQFKSALPPKEVLDSRIPGLDNAAKYYLNRKISRVSDITAISTGFIAAASILLQPKAEWGPKTTVMLQSVWMSANVAHTIKMVTHRVRPYTHEPGFRFTKKDDYYSFISGHSSIVASAAASAWLMRDKNKGITSSKGQKILPISAGILAISTAILRVLAGKHYPSDVLTGLTIGIGIAYINYRIHEK